MAARPRQARSRRHGTGGAVDPRAMNSVRHRFLRPLAAALVLSALVLPASGGDGPKQDKPDNRKTRLAPDLAESIASGSPDELIRVVAVVRNKPSDPALTDLTARLRGMGFTVLGA